MFRMYPPASPGPYPKPMETEHNKAVFEGMYQMRTKLAAAVERCKYVGMTEQVMGYPESAKEYSDIAEELLATKVWLEKYMHGLIELA